MIAVVVVAAARPGIGVPLGVLIGSVSGVVFLFLLHTAFNRDLELRGTMTMAGQLLAVPTFWFGGPWVATTVMNLVDLASILLSYIITLCLVFIAIIIYPVFKLIIRVGNALGKAPSGRNRSVRK